MTDDKLLSLEMQIDSFGSGVRSLLCPYCGGISEQGSPFCCGTLAKAVSAILDRRQLESHIADAERIKAHIVN